ncbi:hypothetical protein E0I61_01965 [Flavobacterium ranwuense]|uniref:Uncharacterized protein n=1 Tax=Flavobacterium ranwuense TaxID=2541725 RepID=A0ABY2DY13_9FLAO|nr:hypothetical protein [Flavobacterium ranwuense]TDE31486.1 hypothetical protein E0I61_01965 [Flavobacterium ranwuense]
MSNCQVEEDVVREENIIQTVSIEEAISFLKQNPLKSRSKSGKKTVSYPIFSAITQEKITNSDQLITVIPLSNTIKQEYSRMLLLKIKDTIKSAVFSMYPDKDTKQKDFSGKIMITTIDGEFVNAFRVKNGSFVSRFVIRTTTNASFRIQNRTIIIDGVEFEELNEVIIPPRNSSNTIEYNVLYDWSAYNDNSNGTGMEWNFGGGGGGSGGSSSEAEPVKEDPCVAAEKTSTISKDTEYLSAFNEITTATATEEHSITLGKDADGKITQAPMNNGGQYIVKTNTTWPGAFAALHNHPNNTPLSSGDIYTSVQLNVKSSNFTTTYILTDGEVYAIVVTDLAAAQAFVTAYPADQVPNYSPEFPSFIFNQIVDLRAKLGESTEARTSAIASILNKYNSGITLLKQDNNGNFYPIIPEAIIDMNGNTIYTNKDCN